MPGGVHLMGTSLSVLPKAKGNHDVPALEHEVRHEDWRGCNTGSAVVGKTLYVWFV